MKASAIGLVLLASLAVFGCSEFASQDQSGQSATLDIPFAPVDLLADFTPPAPEAGVFQICKVGSDADFDIHIVINREGSAPETIDDSVFLKDGACYVAHVEDGGPADEVTVTEVATDGTDLEKVEIYTIDDQGEVVMSEEPGPAVTGSIEMGKSGMVVVFYNTQKSEPSSGRMTGGGHQCRIDGVRITRGFTIHCDIVLSNNLEINWPGGNKWHITKPLTSAECIDDPLYEPRPPAAPFDTFIGEGIGELNGEEGSICRFTFIDDGEPGRDDQATIDIWAPGADPDVDDPVLHVSGYLDGGNIQAHYDQPHGDNG